MAFFGAGAGHDLGAEVKVDILLCPGRGAASPSGRGDGRGGGGLAFFWIATIQI